MGVIWDGPVMFTRLIEDCGHIPELITPHLLAAPFFRRSFSAVIIPGGFAHKSFSSVLPALRACNWRIRRFIDAGGTLIVFGAGIDRPDAYDWLPVKIQYLFGFSEGKPEIEDAHPLSCIIEDCPDIVSIDGVFEIPGSELSLHSTHSGAKSSAGPVVQMTIGGSPVLVEYRSGAGRIIVTSLHEYPSRRFLRDFCCRDGETLL